MNKWDLLSLLKLKEKSDSGYISGEELSQKFKVTRTAVWKYINELKNLGYEIESKTNNGYKILPSFDILNEYEIESRLKKKNLNYEVIYKSSTDSTNNDAKKIAGNCNSNTVVAASAQTAGKGRYGRTFHSENNGGIYFTIRINQGNTDLNIDDITFFPLIAAVGISQAAQDLCGIDLLIKWPNDLLYKSGTTNGGYKKICGILTEASIEAENRSVSYVIVGIGLNVNNNIYDFSEDIQDIATSLNIISNKKYDRTDIMCGIIENFTYFMNLPREKLLEEYKKRLLLGLDISFAQNGKILKGRAYGINESGNLLAEISDEDNDKKIITIQNGEINFI